MLLSALALLSAAPAAANPIGCEVEASRAVEHAPRDQSRVSLTFDEYLGKDTRRILRSLRKAGARATFFSVGKEVRTHKRLTRRILRQGHELANHTFAHRDLTRLSGKRRRAQLRRNQKLVRRVTGFTPCLMRPPFGAVNEAVVGAAERLGLSTVKWDVTGGEVFGARSRDVKRQVLNHTQPGSIILLHQIPNAAEAVPGILRGLEERDLRVVPVTKLLGGRFIR